MTKIYIVHVTTDCEDSIDGVYATHDKARERALELAEYMGAEENTEDYTDFWGDDEANCICITEHAVL